MAAAWLRRGATATALGAVGLSLVPATPDRPSGVDLLKVLPPGLAAAVLAPGVREASLDVTVPMAAADVHLCGVCHVEPASAEAARRAVERHSATAAALAVECDATTLELISAARRALSDMPRASVKSAGLETVRAALFELPTVHELARRDGVALASPAEVPVPGMVVRHLKTDGVLWSCEMAEASAVAAERGVRTVCLGTGAKPGAAQQAAGAPSFLGAAAAWLHAHAALGRGVDAKSCDEPSVVAANEGMRRYMPQQHEVHLRAPDAQMAATVHVLCREAADTAPGGSRPSVVVIVGARHVPGMRALLALDVEA